MQSTTETSLTRKLTAEPPNPNEKIIANLNKENAELAHKIELIKRV